MVRLKPGPTGVLIVDKPAGPTSHGVVAQARRVLQTRAVGHAGTLDPMATGVLVLLAGEATKLSSHLTGQAKTYRTQVRLGQATDTLDAEGTVTETKRLEPGWLHRDTLAAALQQELERCTQVPPAVSAIRTDGVRSYDRVRRGEDVTLDARPVAVHRLELLSFSDSSIELELNVSKGYYVRALARDLGVRLGAPAHLTSLRRIASGQFSIDDAIKWPPDDPPSLLTLEDAARRCLPFATLNDEGERRARYGQPLQSEHFSEPPDALTSIHNHGAAVWMGPDGKVVALGEARPTGFAVVRGFTQRA